MSCMIWGPICDHCHAAVAVKRCSGCDAMLCAGCITGVYCRTCREENDG